MAEYEKTFVSVGEMKKFPKFIDGLINGTTEFTPRENDKAPLISLILATCVGCFVTERFPGISFQETLIFGIADFALLFYCLWMVKQLGALDRGTLVGLAKCESKHLGYLTMIKEVAAYFFNMACYYTVFAILNTILTVFATTPFLYPIIVFLYTFFNVRLLFELKSIVYNSNFIWNSEICYRLIDYEKEMMGK